MNLKTKKVNPSRIGLILLVFIAFIALGLPDGLLGVGWPSIRTSFSIPLDSIGLLLFAAMTGYLTSSFSSGYMLSRLGIGKLLIASCALTGLGLIGYTLVPNWWMMVALGVIAGLGAGGIDAGLNTYVASNFGEGLMQWMHASYGVGATLGPIIMTIALGTIYSWRLGYTIVGIGQLLLAACFIVTLTMWVRKEDHKGSGEKSKRLTDYKTSYIETLRQPQVWLSVLLFFLYTGSEAALGTWTYTLLTESRGILPKVAGLWAGSYWATFTIGRILAGLLTKRIKNHTLVRACLIVALTGATLLWWNPIKIVSLIGVALIGFAIAPIFPGLVSGTSQRVGPKFAANTIGIQLGAAGVGAAVIPGLIGVMARYISLDIIPISIFGLYIALIGLYLFSTQMEIRRNAAMMKEPEATKIGA